MRLSASAVARESGTVRQLCQMQVFSHLFAVCPCAFRTVQFPKGAVFVHEENSPLQRAMEATAQGHGTLTALVRGDLRSFSMAAYGMFSIAFAELMCSSASRSDIQILFSRSVESWNSIRFSEK